MPTAASEEEEVPDREIFIALPPGTYVDRSSNMNACGFPRQVLRRPVLTNWRRVR